MKMDTNKEEKTKTRKMSENYWQTKLNTVQLSFECKSWLIVEPTMVNKK